MGSVSFVLKFDFFFSPQGVENSVCVGMFILTYH